MFLDSLFGEEWIVNSDNAFIVFDPRSALVDEELWSEHICVFRIDEFREPKGFDR